MEEKNNTCGIVGLCLGWLIPLVGIILGIIALARKEKTLAIGIMSIIVSLIAWLLFWVWLW